MNSLRWTVKPLLCFTPVCPEKSRKCPLPALTVVRTSPKFLSCVTFEFCVVISSGVWLRRANREEMAYTADSWFSGWSFCWMDELWRCESWYQDVSISVFSVQGGWASGGTTVWFTAPQVVCWRVLWKDAEPQVSAPSFGPVSKSAVEKSRKLEKCLKIKIKISRLRL